MYICNICDQTFETSRALNGHKNVHKDGPRYKKSRKTGLNKIISNCIQCDSEIAHYPKTPRKFCGAKCQQDWHYYNVTVPKLIEGSCSTSSSMHRFLEERDGRGCSSCKNTQWNNLPIPLDIEHIDGNPQNNKVDNLTYLCPNCHRQTDTWGNSRIKRKMKNGRYITSLVK